MGSALLKIWRTRRKWLGSESKLLIPMKYEQNLIFFCCRFQTQFQELDVQQCSCAEEARSRTYPLAAHGGLERLRG
jgi:hypothetical protein